MIPIINNSKRVARKTTTAVDLILTNTFFLQMLALKLKFLKLIYIRLFSSMYYNIFEGETCRK